MCLTTEKAEYCYHICLFICFYDQWSDMSNIFLEFRSFYMCKNVHERREKKMNFQFFALLNFNFWRPEKALLSLDSWSSVDELNSKLMAHDVWNSTRNDMGFDSTNEILWLNTENNLNFTPLVLYQHMFCACVIFLDYYIVEGTFFPPASSLCHIYTIKACVILLVFLCRYLWIFVFVDFSI